MSDEFVKKWKGVKRGDPEYTGVMTNSRYHCKDCFVNSGWSHGEDRAAAVAANRAPKLSGICKDCSTLRSTDGKCGCNAKR
jgi:hypothetical protein